MCDRAPSCATAATVGTLVPRGRRGGADRRADARRGRDTLVAAIEAASAAAAPPTRRGADEASRQAGSRSAACVVERRPARACRFEVRAGEILGVAALEGQGQDALFDCLAGERQAAERRDRSSTAGRCRPAHPYDAIRAGVVLVPGRPA